VAVKTVSVQHNIVIRINGNYSCYTTTTTI